MRLGSLISGEEEEEEEELQASGGGQPCLGFGCGFTAKWLKLK